MSGPTQQLPESCTHSWVDDIPNFLPRARKEGEEWSNLQKCQTCSKCGEKRWIGVPFAAPTPPQADREAVREAVKAMKGALPLIGVLLDDVAMRIAPPMYSDAEAVINQLTAAIAKLGEE